MQSVKKYPKVTNLCVRFIYLCELHVDGSSVATTLTWHTYIYEKEQTHTSGNPFLPLLDSQT